MSEDTISYILSLPRVSLGLPAHTKFHFDENWVEISPKHVSEWRDFTQQNLENAYGHLLKLTGPDLEDEGWYNHLVDYLPLTLESSAIRWLPPQMASDAEIVRRELPDTQDHSSNLDDPVGAITLVTPQEEIHLVVETESMGWKVDDVLRNTSEKGGPNKQSTVLEHHISKRRVRNQTNIPGADIQCI